MDHPVFQFSKFAAVPSAGCADEVACDSLQFVDVLSTAVRTLLEVLLCVFISAVHAAVPVVVH